MNRHILKAMYAKDALRDVTRFNNITEIEYRLIKKVLDRAAKAEMALEALGVVMDE